LTATELDRAWTVGWSLPLAIALLLVCVCCLAPPRALSIPVSGPPCMFGHSHSHSHRAPQHPCGDGSICTVHCSLLLSLLKQTDPSYIVLLRQMCQTKKRLVRHTYINPRSWALALRWVGLPPKKQQEAWPIGLV